MVGKTLKEYLYKREINDDNTIDEEYTNDLKGMTRFKYFKKSKIILK